MPPANALAVPAVGTPPDAAPGDAPACLVYRDESGRDALLRFAVMTADGRSENRAGQVMPPGTVVDYALRGAAEAWSAGRPWHTDIVCPISTYLFNDPVIAPDGHTYERRLLTQWLQLRHTSPFTGNSFLPAGTTAPYSIRVTSHAKMRACAAWVAAHDPPEGTIEAGTSPLRQAPPLHADINVYVPPPPPRAVPMANLRGLQLPAHLRQHAAPLPPAAAAARAMIGTGFVIGTVVWYGLAMALATRAGTVKGITGCALGFAAPLGAAVTALTARHFVNRHNRRLGIAAL